MSSSTKKPINWINRFDIDVSLDKCPAGENLPKNYKDDFEFVGRKIVDISSVSIDMQVRKELVKNDNVEILANSFDCSGYLHDEYPPIVIETAVQVSGKPQFSYELWIGNNRFAAVQSIDWKKMVVDIYRCKNRKALLSFACTSNHHYGTFKLMTENDYIKAVRIAAFGTDKDSTNAVLGSPIKRTAIASYVEEVVGKMFSSNKKQKITEKVWKLRDVRVTKDKFQPFSLTANINDSINSVDRYAVGKNPFATGIKIPYRGDKHLQDQDNTIEELGYVAGDKKTGIKDKIGLAIRKYNEHKGKRKVLFYLFIENEKGDLTDSFIDLARLVAVKKFKDEIDCYCEFMASITGVEKDVIEKKVNSIFKLVGFLSQKIYIDKNGVVTERTIVDMNGNAVHELTGELL